MARSSYNDPLSMQTTLANALRDLPGAVELRAFGSLTGTEHDRYSDVDLEVLTTDPDASIAARQAIIGRVAPIWLEWRIHPSHSAWAATVLFEGFSPVHHLDLGISPVAATQSIDALGARIVLWTQRPGSAIPAPDPGLATAYTPAIGAPEHAMLEQLLSALRYVKARQRRKVLTAYRFASALAAATVAMLEAERTGDIGHLRQKTSTTSFLALDRHLPASQSRDLLGFFDFSTPERMDAAVLSILRHNLALHATIPGANAFPASIAARLLTFIESELHG